MYRLDGTEFKKINGVWYIDGQPITIVEKELKNKYWFNGFLVGYTAGLIPALIVVAFL